MGQQSKLHIAKIMCDESTLHFTIYVNIAGIQMNITYNDIW